MAIMYMLGGYAFSSNTAVPRSVGRETTFSWSKHNRINNPVLQATGLGDDKIKLDGIMYPTKDKTGIEQLALLRAEASQMLPLMFVDGKGYIYGRWAIKKITEGRAYLWQNSDPRKITFKIELEKYGEDAV